MGAINDSAISAIERPSGAVGAHLFVGGQRKHDGCGHLALQRLQADSSRRLRKLPAWQPMQIALRLLGFGMNLIEAGNVIVPLKQRWRGPATLDGARIELPDRIDHRMVVRVENVLFVPRVTGDMNLRHAVRGHRVDVIHRLELMIHGRDIDVVHVQQNAAVGALHDFGQELPLGHL